MELINHRDLATQKLILRLCKTLLCMTFVATVFIFSHLITAPYPTFEKKETLSLPSTDPSRIGGGALALLPLGSSRNMHFILQDLILVGANTRPDQDHDRQLTLALRSSGEQKTLSIGETVFLQFKMKEWSFSSEATQTSLTPRFLEGEQLVCELKKEGLHAQCILTPSPIFSKPLQNEIYTHQLKKGGVWGPDLFLKKWGGEDYRDLTKKVKISIGADVFFLRSGDCIWWNGSRWVQEIHTDTLGPIAQLMKTSSPVSQGVDFQVWDETGFSSEVVHLLPQALAQPQLKMSELMTAIRPRSASAITCQLGKRRVIVKEGDWWIRSDGRWRPVRTAADLEACLYHQIPGELFIFEKIESLKGKIVLKGEVFDRMRVSCEPISLIVETEKKHSFRTNRGSVGNPSLIAKNKSHRPFISSRSKEQGNL